MSCDYVVLLAAPVLHLVAIIVNSFILGSILFPLLNDVAVALLAVDKVIQPVVLYVSANRCVKS